MVGADQNTTSGKSMEKVEEAATVKDDRGKGWWYWSIACRKGFGSPLYMSEVCRERERHNNKLFLRLYAD
jgi:hypothetical protein